MASLNAHVVRRPPGGMIVRSTVELASGTGLAKLGHSMAKGNKLSPEQILFSPWWLAQADFDELVRRARMSGSKLSSLWRQFGAIATQFGGSGDLIVKATLAGPLTAHIGPGTIQDRPPADDPTIDHQPLWVPPPHITQVYVPGLDQPTADGVGIVGRVALAETSIARI